MAEKKMLRAIASFVIAARKSDNGPVRAVVHEGDVLASTDPLVKGREHLFMPLDEYLENTGRVERATAVPGEARAVTPPNSNEES